MKRLAFLLSLSTACIGSRSDNTAPPSSASLQVASDVLPQAFAGALPWHADNAGFKPLRAGLLEGTLPLTAASPIRLAVRGAEGTSIDLVPIGLVDARGETAGAALLYREVAPSTDSIWITTTAGIEELRVLRRSGRITIKYRLGLGRGVAAVNVHDRRVEAVDGSGNVVLAAAPAFAVDAHGTRVELDARYTDGVLSFDGDGSQLLPPIVVDPSWTATGPMTETHAFGRAATILPSGKVLVTGGQTSGAPRSAAEIWDAVTKNWTAAASMLSGREGHSAFVTAGKVLVCGGNPTWAGGLSTCESYDPAADTWTPAGGFSTRRGHHALISFGGGKFLAAGGLNSVEFLSTAEFYDEALGTWASVPAMAGPRAYAFGVAVGGKGYVIGGRAPGSYSAAVEVFDPATKTWSTAASMAASRSWFGAALLPTGRILVAGGRGSFGDLSFAEMFDPTTGTWSSVPNKPGAVGEGYGAPLPGGAFLSSRSSAEVQLFDAATSSWIAAPSMSSANGRLPISLGAGQVLAVGVSNSSVTDTSAELYISSGIGAPCTKGVECATGTCASAVCAMAMVDAGPSESGTDSGVTDTAVADTAGAADTGTSDTAAADTAAADTTTGDTAFADTAPADTATIDSSTTDGKSLKSDGEACAATAECSSGFCIDGVCCNAACDGQCQACDVPGKIGSCSVVSGAPHGTRPNCGDGTACTGKCDGVDTQRCVYPPSGTSCPSTCESGGIATRACDGKGTCATTSTTSCSPFLCQDDSCNTTCATNADCENAFACSEGQCVPVSTETAVAADSGCGCTIVGRHDPATGAIGAAAALAAVLSRRPHRRRR